VAAQCCIDICHRIIALENARKPVDYYEAILILGELEILPPDFAQQLAPLAGFRNILIHEYLGIDWDRVFDNLHKIGDIANFAIYIRQWLSHRSG
jgi:uncharacterized protein YutE (UPF0331/DUF86 family)